MLPDLRTRSKLREFFLGWLKISQPRDLSKDPKAFPEFTPDVISDLRTSVELSLDDVLDSGSADFRQFLLTDDMYFNGRLAKLYGAKLPDNSPFQKSRFRIRPSRRRPFPSVPISQPRLHKLELADPSRRFPLAQRARPRASPTCASRRSASAGNPRRSEQPRTRRPANPAGNLPGLPCYD